MLLLLPSILQSLFFNSLWLTSTGQQADAHLLRHTQGQRVVWRRCTVEQENESGKLCDAGLKHQLPNNRYQKKDLTTHPSRFATRLIDHHGKPGSPHIACSS